jgi:hypothetical protein
MDCKNARLLFDFARPGHEELAPDEAAVLQQHVQHCPDCQEALRAERCLDEAVGRVMLDVPIPDGLQMRLLGQLQRQRDRWSRRLFFRVATAAALVVVTIGLGWYGLTRSVPEKLNLETVHSEAANRQRAGRAEVDEWLKQVSPNQPLTAPPDFNYDLLDGDRYKITMLLDSKPTPTLFFSALGGKAFARVYILSSQRYDLADIEAQTANASLKSDNVNVDVRRNPTDPEVFYVVVYSGHSLRPFLHRDQGPNV